MDVLWHQFSTGVMTAYSSSRLLRQTLSQNRYAALDFRIPVYNNMPDEPAEEPDYNDELNNYYFTDMQAEGLKPEFSMANRNYTMTVTQDTVLDIAVPEWAAYEGSDSYILEPGENEILLDVRSQTGYLRTYIIKVTSSTDLTLTINTYVGNHLNISESEETGEKVQEDEKQEIQNGDANGDGKITSADYVVIRNHIMQNRVISDSVLIAAADANNDGKINSLDYITLKNMIMAN